MLRTWKAKLALVALLVSGSLLLPAPAHASRSAIVVDLQTGAIVYQSAVDHQHYPASLTKMMTLYLLFEALERGELTMDTELTVSTRAAGQPKSRLGLRRGQTIRVEDAIQALIIRSANDVATVVAEALGKEEWKFARLMTGKARDLGMWRTRFRNASGLPNRRQYTTARDMAVLARALVKDFPQYYHYFGARSFELNGKVYETHNALLLTYAGMDGLKTGYTRASGFNLAASVERGGRRVVAIVLGERTPQSRDRRMVKLLNQSFERIFQARIEVPPAPPPEKPLAETGTPWAIQVGAFTRLEVAYDALRRSETQISDIVAGAAAVVIPIEEGDGGLYRARFVGLNIASAHRACRVLKRGRLPCDVVRHASDTEAVIIRE